MTKAIYETPTVSVEIFSIEQGFARSNLGGKPSWCHSQRE